MSFEDALSEVEADRALPIEELDLPVRTYSQLKREAINTIGEAADYGQRRLLKLLGSARAEKVRTAISGSLGLPMAE